MRHCRGRSLVVAVILEAERRVWIDGSAQVAAALLLGLFVAEVSAHAHRTPNHSATLKHVDPAEGPNLAQAQVASPHPQSVVHPRWSPKGHHRSCTRAQPRTIVCTHARLGLRKPSQTHSPIPASLTRGGRSVLSLRTACLCTRRNTYLSRSRHTYPSRARR
eukprot:364034-Chlamydomonas_euryale.AAC.4